MKFEKSFSEKSFFDNLRYPLYSRVLSDEEAVTTVYRPNYANIFSLTKVLSIVALIVGWTAICIVIVAYMDLPLCVSSGLIFLAYNVFVAYCCTIMKSDVIL